MRVLERTDACPACGGAGAGCRRCGGAGVVQVALPPIDRVTLTLPSGLGPRLAPADSIDAPPSPALSPGPPGTEPAGCSPFCSRRGSYHSHVREP